MVRPPAKLTYYCRPECNGRTSTHRHDASALTSAGTCRRAEGLWHGASWNFVMWGGLNGAGRIQDLETNRPGRTIDDRWYHRLPGIAITLLFITFSCAWFRGESWESSVLMLRLVFTNFQLELAWNVLVAYQPVFWTLLIGFVIHWLPTRFKHGYRRAFIRAPLLVKTGITLICVILLYQAMSADLQPFIYFDF